eukprot:TRINITY_DN64209_c0_g1_i1.p1 TRINITY_DN64209_c0_g1~~TRINITY_DN64209_c0_g1_i1.p1  ORF type:complete len:308 (-),score=41.28 TRINITY_DN64209_c0_g1_i1:397-1320(-)
MPIATASFLVAGAVQASSGKPPDQVKCLIALEASEHADAELVWSPGIQRRTQCVERAAKTWHGPLHFDLDGDMEPYPLEKEYACDWTIPVEPLDLQGQLQSDADASAAGLMGAPSMQDMQEFSDRLASWLSLCSQSQRETESLRRHWRFPRSSSSPPANHVHYRLRPGCSAQPIRRTISVPSLRRGGKLLYHLPKQEQTFSNSPTQSTSARAYAYSCPHHVAPLSQKALRLRQIRKQSCLFPFEKLEPGEQTPKKLSKTPWNEHGEKTPESLLAPSPKMPSHLTLSRRAKSLWISSSAMPRQGLPRR